MSKDSDDLMRRIDRPGNQMFDTESNRRHVKPTALGIMPRWMHNELRRQELQEAIWRYTIHEPPIMAPAEWIEEFNELTEWFQRRGRETSE